MRITNVQFVGSLCHYHSNHLLLRRYDCLALHLYINTSYLQTSQVELMQTKLFLTYLSVSD